MKLNSILVLTAVVILPHTTSAECNLCPDGITVEEGSQPLLDAGDESTCEDLIELATSMSDATGGDEFCESMKVTTEILCCNNNPCTICAGGITAEDEFAVSEDMSCKDLVELTAQMFSADDEMCEASKMNEVICCPEQAATANEDGCKICEDGITVGENFIPDFGDDSADATCEQIVALTSQVFSEGDEGCKASKANEIACCPQVQANPCLICPNGISVAEDLQPFLEDQDEITCKELVDTFKNFDKDDVICKLSLQETAETENPCCPSSVTATQSGGGESTINDEDPADNENKEPAASDGDVLAKSETASSATTGVIGGFVVLISTVSAISFL